LSLWLFYNGQLFRQPALNQSMKFNQHKALQ